MSLPDFAAAFAYLPALGNDAANSPPVIEHGACEAKGECCFFKRQKCTLRWDAEALQIVWSEGQPTKLAWTDIQHTDLALLAPQKETKLVVVAVHLGKATMFKVWLPTLAAVDDVLKVLREKQCQPKYGCVPSMLHTPFLLPYYHPAMRWTLYQLGSCYHAILKLALFFYVLNMILIIPDTCETETLLLGYAYTAIDLLMTSPATCTADATSLAICGAVSAATVLALPFIVTIVIPGIILVAAFLLARHYLAVLLSLTVLNDVQQITKIVKAVGKTLKTGIGAISSLRPKPKVLEKPKVSEKED